MRIYNEEIGEFINVHPTFFYESVLNLVIFAILMFLNFRVSQIFSILIVFFSIIMYYFGEKCRRKD